MKRLVWFLTSVAAALIGVLIVACEKHKDPFSANNNQPLISVFRFRADPDLPPNTFQDSLRFKPGKTFRLQLQYDDREFSSSDTRKLQAIFSFENGSGKITNDKFGKPSADGLRFDEAPGTFSDDLLFTPAAPGRITLRLQLFDGVKLSGTQQATATFFENLKPTPVFAFTLRNQTQPYKVEFDPRGSLDRDGNVAKAKFIWNFGDNSSDSVGLGPSIITHDYKLAGQYRVRLKIIDDESKPDSTEQFVTTNNQPPQAALRITPTSGKVPLEIDYTATNSFDPDGTISSYQIFFGDGETSQDPIGKHAFKNDGNYQVMLIVKDNLGLADTTNVPVRVSTPPIAALKIDPESGGKIPLDLTVSGKASSDPHPNGSITAYLIVITNVTTNAQRSFPQDSVTTKLTEPAYYRISLTVTNNRGLTNVAEKVIPAGLP
ncbi:MAG: PKD domain-containing protein [bacterium]